MTIRLGTRGSSLARAQAGDIARRLAELGADVELVIVRTEGDTSTASLATIGGTGVFAGALRASLQSGGCDLVVHSMKDLPVQPYSGLLIAAVPEREDPRDALCSRDGVPLDLLVPGSRVGTGSPRRRAQLAARRPDLEIIDIRGNVDTRLKRVTAGDLDGVVLAAAGLARLGLQSAISECFDLESWPTAAGQGSLALEIRDRPADDDLAQLVARLDVPTVATGVAAERAVLGALEAGCAAPIGVASTTDAAGLRLHAVVYRPDGGDRVEATEVVPDPGAGVSTPAAVRAARALAARLLDAGADRLAPLGSVA